jgi:hypothetical protein
MSSPQQSKGDLARARLVSMGLHHPSVRAVLVNRVSAESAAKFETQADSGVAKYVGMYPELGQLTGREASLFETSGAKAARAGGEREARGMRSIIAGAIAADAHRPKSIVGFSSVVGQVLILDVMHSAAADDVADGSDIDGFGRNLYTELVRTVVVGYEQQLERILFSRWDRVARNSRHGALLTSTLAERSHWLSLYVDGDVVKDPQGFIANHQQSVALEGRKSDQKKHFSGTYSKAQNNGFPRPSFHLPYGVMKGVGENKGKVLWVERDALLAAELYELRAAGTPIGLVAERATELGLRTRHPLASNLNADGSQKTLQQRYPGDTAGTVLRHREAREAVVRTLFQPSHRVLYRTGALPFRLVAPTPGVAQVDGADLEFATGPEPVWHPRSRGANVDLRVYGFHDFLLQWGLPPVPPRSQLAPEAEDPVEGLGLRTSQWEALECLYATPALDGEAGSLRRTAGGARSTDDDLVRPFLGLHTWFEHSVLSTPEPGEGFVADEDGLPCRRVERQIGGGNPNAVNVRERQPQTRGWGTNEGHIVATVPDDVLAKSLASALRAVLIQVGDSTITFTATRRRNAHVEKLALLQAKLVAAQDLAATMSKQAEGHRRALAMALADDPDSTAAREEAQAHQADGRRAACEAAAAAAEATQLQAKIESTDDDAAMSVERLSVDLTRVAVLADVLDAGAANPRPRFVREVHDAVATIFQDTFRLDPDTTNHRLAYWRGTLHLQAGGQTITHELAPVAVPNSVRPTNSPRIATEVAAEASAVYLLRDGHSLTELFGFSTKSDKAALKSTRGWLDSKGVTKRGLRSAAVDCPVPETKLAVWAATSGDNTVAAHLHDGFRRHIGGVYTSQQAHPQRWVARDTSLARRACATILALPDPGMGVLAPDLAVALGVSLGEVHLLTAGASGRYSGVLVRDTVNRARLRLRECPHTDCPMAAGSRWASHYLPVPETTVPGGHGLLCPDCQRVPDDRYVDVRFPAAYLSPWDTAGDVDAPGRSLADGPMTVMGELSRYLPSGTLTAATELTNNEAAASLEVPQHAVRTWSKAGLLGFRWAGGGPGRPRRVYARAELDRVRELDFVVAARRAYRPRGSVPSDVATVGEVAEWAQVRPEHLRRLLNNGTLQARTGAANGYRANLLSWTQVREVLTPLWRCRHNIDCLSVGDVATRAHITPGQVRAASNNVVGPDDDRELPSLRTDGGTRVFEPAVVEDWLAGAGRAHTLLLPKQAAALAGTDTDALRRAVASGELVALTTAGGHARYDRADLLTWAQKPGR